ncbi:MAG: hypothetical protein V1754_09300 [Pseudomonadota bacterium]
MDRVRNVFTDPRGSSNRCTPLPLGPALRIQQATELRRRIQAHMRATLQLSLTDNRAVMISVRRQPEHKLYKVRLHYLFMNATQEIVECLAQYVMFNDRTSSRKLGAFIEQHDACIVPNAPLPQRHVVLRTKGRTYDLQEIFDKLNAQYFDSQVKAKITWGKRVEQKNPDIALSWAPTR